MYKRSGVGSGAWSTEKEANTYGPLKGISNYGLLPVGYKDADVHWEKTKKEIGQDFRELRKNSVIASKKAGKYIIDKVKKHPEYVAGLTLEALGIGAKYSGIEGLESIGDELIAGGLIPFVTKFVNYAIKRAEKRVLKEEYFNLMKELMTSSDFQPDEKIDARYLMGVDKFTPKLSGGNGYKTGQLEGELESMKTCFKG